MVDRTAEVGPGDEPVEWLDGDGEVIAVVSRARMRRENLRHRSCGVVVRSSDGRLLVHRRSTTKDLLPGWWDVCAGGVLAVGEPPADGAVRELAEELGVHVDPGALRLLGVGSFDDETSRELSTVFEVTHDGPFHFSDGEVAEVRWVDPVSLDAMMASDRFLPTCRALVLPLVAGFGRPADGRDDPGAVS